MVIWSPTGGLAENRGVAFTAATIDWTLGLSQTVPRIAKRANITIGESRAPAFKNRAATGR